MSEVTDLTVLEIKPEQAPALYVANGLDAYLDIIREMAKEVPDVTTKKGRDRIGSLARMVGSSKKAIEEPGRAYLRHLKEAVKPAEGELRRFTTECDSIRNGILKPRDDWEAEQLRLQKEEEERIAAEAYNAMRDEADAMNSDYDRVKAEALKKQIEADHEIALLLNEKFDRDLAEAKAEAERQRIAHEEELKRQAEEKVKRELEEKQQREREENQRREDELKLKIEATERQRLEDIAQAERDRIAADKIKRDNEAKEAVRLAEVKRVADEKAKREADETHRKVIGTAIVNALLANTSLSRAQSIEVLTSLKDGLIPHTGINY